MGTRRARRVLACLMLTLAPACNRAEEADQLSSYCTKAIDTWSVYEPLGARELPEEERKALVGQLAGRLVLLSTELSETAPRAARDDAEALVDRYREVVKSRDSAGFTIQELTSARSRLHEFDLENCKLTRIEVGGKDFAFEGLENTYRPNSYSFEFENAGAEAHEMVLLRKNDGVTEPFVDLLGMPREELLQRVSQEGGAFADKGSSNFTLATLRPGDYAVACLIPAGDGEPHFKKGMLTEFLVS